MLPRHVVPNTAAPEFDAITNGRQDFGSFARRRETRRGRFHDSPAIMDARLWNTMADTRFAVAMYILGSYTNTITFG